MTMKVTEHVISTKRKKHPNDGRYPCRPSQELLHAGMKLMTSLSESDRALMKQNKLIIDEEETAELFDEIKEKDIIGVGILRKTGFIANKYEVTNIVKSNDYLVCQNLLTKEAEEISFQDISVGFAMGFAEILYRDEKPFGVSEEIEFTLKIHSEEKEETNSENSSEETKEKAMASELDTLVPTSVEVPVSENTIETETKA